jgi:hypothetical protein
MSTSEYILSYGGNEKTRRIFSRIATTTTAAAGVTLHAPLPMARVLQALRGSVGGHLLGKMHRLFVKKPLALTYQEGVGLVKPARANRRVLNATAVQAATPPCEPSPSSEFESRFDAGKTGSPTTIPFISKAVVSEVRRCPLAPFSKRTLDWNYSDHW